MINPDKLHRHYKNKKLYRIVQIATNPNTGEEIVVYREFGIGYIEFFWRPATEFEEKFKET